MFLHSHSMLLYENVLHNNIFDYIAKRSDSNCTLFWTKPPTSTYKVTNHSLFCFMCHLVVSVTTIIYKLKKYLSNRVNRTEKVVKMMYRIWSEF